MRKYLALLLAMAMCFSLFGCSSSKPAETVAVETVPAVTETQPQETTVPVETTVPAEPAEDIVILYTNDIHTHIDGTLSYAALSGLKESLQGIYENVLLVDAGDAVQGTAFGAMDKGQTIVSLMNAAGYDAATLGNHEFDYGMEGVMNILEWAEFPYLSCNFYHEENGVKTTPVLDAYKIFDIGGRRIAFVGITTPESITKSTPAYFQDGNGNYIYGIEGGTDGAALYADVQEAVDAARAEGATMVIGLGHLGVDPASQPWTSEEVIANVTGLDAFIDGHSHTEMEKKDINGTLLTQTGEYFGSIGMMYIDGETHEILTDLIGYEEVYMPVRDEKGVIMLDEDGNEVTELAYCRFISDFDLGSAWASNGAVEKMENEWISQIDTELGEVIGSTALTFDNYDADGNRLVRSQETNTGDFAADALFYLFDNMGLDVDVAIMNGGGIRNTEITGELTYKVAKNIHTFGNVACLQTITGQQLLDALEWGARGVGTGEEIGGFLHVAGITYKIDDQWPTSVQMDDKGVWTGGPTGGYKVHDVQVYNKETGAYEPLDLNASYNLAGYNYTLRNLGDGFNMFAGAVNVLDYVMEDYMVLANYIQAFDGGMVEATNAPLTAKYPGMLLDYSNLNGSGRIVMEAAK